MSFGYGVGDFFAVYQLARRIRKEFVNAPSQFRDISDEVRSLSIVLQDVEVIPEQGLTSQQKTELHNIAESCWNVLGELENTLSKYFELSSISKDVGKRVNKVWKRLKWEPEDIKELRSRISSNISLLSAFNSQLTRNNTIKLIQHTDDQERQNILGWLTSTDFGTQQSDFINRQQEGTGRWLLDSDEFQRWFKESKKTLFCPGIPGAGKTIMTSIVVDHLNTKYGNDNSVGIAYLYCNYQRQQEQKPIDLLSSLLKQLVQAQPSVPENVKSLYQSYKDKPTRPSFDEISNVLHSIVAGYSRAFIVVDALDECQISDGSRRRFLLEILNLQATSRTNLFATSRYIPEIEKWFEEAIILEIRANDEDVRRYLDNHISELPLFVSRSLNLQEEIKTAILKAVDGMFLLSQLHLHSLIGKRSPKAIRTALEKLPTGSKAYDDAYNEAMDRINGQISDSQELAKQVLLWITCAKRPLTTLEIQHALAIEIGESKLDVDNLSEIEDIISVCAGLVTVDKKSDIIRLVHYTTQEYFERTWTSWFPTAQTDITKTCVTYLSFNNFNSGFCLTGKEFKARLQSYILYDYAARNWGHHARAASVEVEQLILDFLKSEAKVSSCSQAMMASRGYSWESDYRQELPSQMTGVHLAAYFGLKEAMTALLKSGYDLDPKDSYTRTPLQWAVIKGHEAVVKLLLEKDAELESKDNDGRTPLWWAAAMERVAMVKLLLEKGAELESKDETYGQTPLSRAAANRYEAVVKLLLENGAELESKDKEYGRAPLLWAAEKRREAVVKLLLEKGAKLESKDGYCRTPLIWAAENGHEAVVKLLLEKGAKLESKDGYGLMPLVWAAENGHEAVVKLLLEKGVELESKHGHSRTPLLRAAEEGHEAVVKLLLEKGAELESKEKEYGRTPLSQAAINGHQAVVKLLLEKGAELESKDGYGRTPLSRAAINGREAVVKLLLEKGAELDSKDNWGGTPLSRAAEKGREAVVKLLLEKDAELESKDGYSWTPLLWAAGNGHERVVKLLLEEGAELESKDKDYGRTPLLLATRYGHKAVVKLLLEKGGQLEPESSSGRTPLSLAAENGHEAVVKLLLEEGANLESKDKHDGRTPLSWATGNWHSEVAKLLLEKGANLDLKDNDGRTPLSYAAGYKIFGKYSPSLSRAKEKEHKAMVKLLLEKGAELESKDNNGRTPLSWATRMGHEAIVKLLLEKGAKLESKDKQN